ncbi:serine hydrolase domain-containing protein [Rhodocytophaga aerolata]|uniref:Serine hydrolase domain-containing protein n=1 Tax=Rhodocytophaga aerolata TaxID=455078 RepID=A0ABT8RHD7_9BACT|nr:serine hydrolase domain-containing protein [Rhodocytophaga aerolata]MDO1451500.1 serine hydrolase domain-containing protein [Rhodocytophaga aerolata]
MYSLIKPLATILSLCVVLVLCVSCEKKSIQQPPACGAIDYSNHPSHKYYSQMLSDFYLSNNLPGAIVAVLKEGDPLWIGVTGKASLTHDVNMNTCTPFRTGSISKVFIATVIMQLREQNLLDLDDTLSDLLPEVKGNIPAAEKITLRHLLNHSSGLGHPSDDDPAYQLQIINNPEGMANMSIEDKLKTYVYGKALKFEPGTGSYYSNAGYWIAGKIIEKITKMPIETALSNLLFTPYGLSDTYLEVRDQPTVARGYNYVSGKLTDLTQWDMADSRKDPAGGVVSCAADLCLFSQQLFTGKIISATSLEEMKQTTKFPSCPNGDCEYGLGIESWNTSTHKGYGKNGTLPGVDANFIYFPDKKTTIVIFTNYGGGSRKALIETIVDNK